MFSDLPPLLLASFSLVPRSCTTPRCDKPAEARTLCQACYFWFLRHGERPTEPRRYGLLSDFVLELLTEPLFADIWTVPDLAARLGFHRSAVSRVLRKLEADGLVVRQRHSGSSYRWRAVAV